MKIINQIKQQGLVRSSLLLISRFIKLLILAIGICGFTVHAQSQSWQSLDKVRNTAKNFLEEMQLPADNENIEVIVSHIDPRTRLAECRVPLKAFLAPGARSKGKTTVGIECSGNKSWKLYVSARVVEYQEVWVTSRPLNKTDILSLGDLEKKRISIERLRKSPLLDSSRIVNTSPKRRLRAGEVIFQDSVCLVCRGQIVSVSAHNQFLAINVEGVALADAAMGEIAKIRNTRSKRVFDAIVTGKNQLSIRLAQASR